MPLPRLLLTVAAIALTQPALADAVTYTGTLGKTAIVVELSSGIEDAAEPFAGRYFYRSQGIDIPLDRVQVKPGVVDLDEEMPCNVGLCHDAENGGTPETPPIDATWHLESDDGGATISGTWTDVHDKTLPIKLKRAGSRTFASDSDTIDMYGFANPGLPSDEIPITMENAPYDTLRMETKTTESAVTRWGDVAFRYVTDPRTKFAYPRVTDLGGGNIAPLNAALQMRHWNLNYSAFDCARMVYQGFGWNEFEAPEAGSLGGYEDETVEVTYLSPTVMSWTESGSLFCGGAHPDNHHEFYNADARTGEPLDLSRIFKGWTVMDGTDIAEARKDYASHVWGPDETLAAFVRAHRVPSGDADLEADCGYDDLIASNLAIGFKQPDHVLFSLDALPNAVVACGYDLYEAPIGELKALLAPTAAKYFPTLGR